jgi:hypothetical protein
MVHRVAKLFLILSMFASGILRGGTIDYARDIRPILSDKCYKCHGPDANARKAKLRLNHRENAFSKRKGNPAIKPGDISHSAIIQRILSTDPDERMPPPDSGLSLLQDEKDLLIEWVRQGANWPKDDRHWAFIPPIRPPLPNTNDTTWARNSIDLFILGALESGNKTPAPEANRETLLRRVSYDLTGLPPTITEQDAFLADESPDAYEKVIDRLLRSPRHAEHAASYWLDASRYADTDGYQNDRYRYMHVWRDWVIRAFNENMPFDRFITEQMAGDLLPDRDFYTQVATGFNRNHRINSEGGSIPDEWIVEYVADRVETLGTVFLGLTFNCARCHDHKYDPVTQKDFYSLFAFFNGIDEAGLGPNNGNSPPFIPVPKSWPRLSLVENKFTTPAKMKIKVVQTSVPRPQSGSPSTVMVMHQLEKPRPTYRLNRGQYDNPDKSVVIQPNIPETIGGWLDEWPRNRIGIAKWLTSPDHPLTARVTVNRYWQRFFGTGIVRTSENFGIQGEAPTNPQLLDWLATELIRLDWDLKAFQKLIVTSSSYRQQSKDRKAVGNEGRDRRRLHPYGIRDTALAASGLLVEKLGGPSVKPYMPPRIWKSISNNGYKQDKGDKLYRRSLYTYWRRTIPPPTMMTFNSADREICSVRKDHTTTPLQALTLMNNITFVETSRFLAERMLTLAKSPSDRISLGFRAILCRKPGKTELNELLADLNFYRKDFEKNPTEAKKFLKIGEKPANPKLDAVELAAYALIANTLLNLDETITLN